MAYKSHEGVVREELIIKDIREAVFSGLYVINIRLGNVKHDPKYLKNLKKENLRIKSLDHLDVIEELEKHGLAGEDLALLDEIIEKAESGEETTEEYLETIETKLGNILDILKEYGNRNAKALLPRVPGII